MSQEKAFAARSDSNARPSTASAKLKAKSQKAIAFALMLTVPVALSGCNTTSSRDCVDYDNDGYCDDNGSRSGGTYITNGKSNKKSSSYKSSSSASKGFGSSGISSGSSGG
jgi:hypothetical protein